MEPQSANFNSAPNQGPEQRNNAPENVPVTEAGRKLEKVPITGLEQLRDVETHEFGNDIGQNSPKTTLPASNLPQIMPVQPLAQTNDAVAVAPLQPSDDVIDKRWVNETKGVLKATAGDPHAKKHEISKLTAQYTKETTGKQLKIPEDT